MIPSDVMQWLDSYSGSFEFYLSVRDQARSKGRLSDRQIDAVRRAMVPKAPAPTLNTGMLKIGDFIEIGVFIARRAQKDLNLDVMFRNVRVESILRETQKAYQVTVSFVAKVCASCYVCGLELDTEISRACGIGPVCAKKLGVKRYDHMSAEEILVEVNAICQRIGVVGPFWLPKSQVKQVDRVESGPSKLELA